MNNGKIKSIIESLLFIWGEPLNVDDIKNILNIGKREVLEVLIEMQSDFKNDKNRGLELKQFGNTFQLVTKKSNYEYISMLYDQNTNKKNLSNAAIEILSIVAYKQPVTRVDIEDIRGVKSSNTIKGLVDKNLIKEVGRLEKIGRPHLYGTTNLFLKHFNLKTLDDLPEINLEDKTVNKEE